MNTSLEIIRSAGTDYLCYRMEDDTFVAVHNPMLSFTEKEDEFEIIPPDNSYREKLYSYQGQAVRLVPRIYCNGWLALCLELADTEEPYTTLTVNLEDMDAIGLPDKAFIDINNNPDAMEFLVLNNLATDTGYRRGSGWVEYPMAHVNLPLVFQHCPEAFNHMVAPAFIFMPYENRFQRTSRKNPQGDYGRHKSGIGGIRENGNGVSRYGGCRVRDMVRP